jgi:hypothetical protein
MILAFAWRWLALPSTLPGDVRTASISSPAAISPATVLGGPLSGSSGSQKSLPLRNVEDPRCLIRSKVSLEPGDAGTDDAATALAREPASADPGRVRLLERLRTGGDAYANAVAIWLDIPDDDDRRAERDRRLAAMAASTQDPRLYSLVLRDCWRKAGRECPTLSARRWSELEPDNAMPWLMMMDEARLRQDASAFKEALYHATQAQRLAERPLAPVQAIVDAASDDDPASLVAARSLAIDAFGIAAAQVGAVSALGCREATSSADANLWQQCIALADLLEHRSDTLSARGMGAAIDKRQTGNAVPAKQVAAQVQHLASLDLESSSSCSDLRSKLVLMRRMAVEGDATVMLEDAQ